MLNCFKIDFGLLMLCCFYFLFNLYSLIRASHIDMFKQFYDVLRSDEECLYHRHVASSDPRHNAGK